jgi:hypothetical protein
MDAIWPVISTTTNSNHPKMMEMQVSKTRPKAVLMAISMAATVEEPMLEMAEEPTPEMAEESILEKTRRQ